MNIFGFRKLYIKKISFNLSTINSIILNSHSLDNSLVYICAYEQIWVHIKLSFPLFIFVMFSVSITFVIL